MKAALMNGSRHSTFCNFFDNLCIKLFFSHHIGEILSIEGLISDMNVHVSQCPHCPKCVPYTPQACIVAALQNGYKIGSEFEG